MIYYKEHMYIFISHAAIKFQGLKVFFCRLTSPPQGLGLSQESKVQ
jgi:hypothetical protein